MAENAEYSPVQQPQCAANQDSVHESLESFDPPLESAANNDDTEPDFDLGHLQLVVQTALRQMYQRDAFMKAKPVRTNEMRAQYLTIDADRPDSLATFARLLTPVVQNHAPQELSILEGISWMTHDDNKPHIMSQLHRHLYTKEGRRGDYGEIVYPEKVDVGTPIHKFALWQSPIRKVPTAAQNHVDQSYLPPEQDTEIIISMIPNPSLYKNNPLTAPPILKCGALHLRGLSALDSHSEPSASSNLVMNTFEALKTALSWRDRVPPPPSAKGAGPTKPQEDAHARFNEGYQFVGREMFFARGLVLREHDWRSGTWAVRSHVWDATDDEGNVVKEIITIDDAGC